MKARTRRLAAALLAAALPASAASPPSLSADLAISSTTSPARSAPLFQLRFEKGPATGGRAVAGVSLALDEGKPLQAGLWGGAGAIIGSLAGPLGAGVGGATGVLLGLVFGKRTKRTAPGYPPYPSRDG